MHGTYLLTHSLTHSLTPWRRIFLENWELFILLKNSLLSLWNPKFHQCVHKNPPLDPILSQSNPVRAYQRISLGPRRYEIFRNIYFYGEGLLDPPLTPKLEDHSLSAFRDWLFNIFAAVLHIRKPSSASAPWGRAMPWWQGTHLTWNA
jgi:hypothetical protein